MKWLSHRVLTALGWEFLGEVPDVPKMVIIGAPHTSNWDFFLFLAALHHYRLSVNYLGKHTLFRWPFGFLFRRLGGIPVDRSRAGGVVGQVKQEFDQADQMILVLAPEGTRKAAPQWKSGFLEIATAAQVPIVLAGVNYPSKTVTIGPHYEATAMGLMDAVRAFYADKVGRHPQGKGPVALRTES